MAAEAGYGVEDTPPPLRVSGYLCLILGVLSVFAVVGTAALVLPILAVLFGLFAHRRYGEQVPAGLRAAKVGLVFAAGFGACGLFVPMLKSMTLGAQAEQFARDYVEVVAHDELELAMELRKNYVNRFPTTMPLPAHYTLNENADRSMEEFRQDGVNAQILNRGPGAEWRLTRPVRIFNYYGSHKAEVTLQDPSGGKATELYMLLEYQVDHRNGDGQWFVERVMFNTEPIVAPLVL
jgi:hypothetical protein